MPRILADFEAPARVPDVALDWWRSSSPPWCADVTAMPVDRDRTEAFHQLPVASRVRATGRVPLQVCPRRTTLTVSWRSPGVHRVPFPTEVWVIGNSDRQWFGVDLERMRYWEASAVRPSLWGMSADRVVSWDLNGPWQAIRGLTGAGVPMWAMMQPDTALHFVVAGDYSEKLSPLGAVFGKTDGTLADHPLRSGERLRMSWQAFDRHLSNARTADDLALLDRAYRRGAILTDQTTADVGHNLRLPVGANVTLALDATDFEVLSQ